MSDRTCRVVEDGSRCPRPVKGRGYCGKHYDRWRKYGDPLTVLLVRPPLAPEAEAERRRKIGDAARGKTLPPKSTDTRRKLSEANMGKTLSPEHRAALAAAGRQIRERTAQKSREQWEKWREERGLEKPGYYGLHRRVRTARGPAKNQICVECGEPAKHWATIHGTDGTDPMLHYRPMCAECHFAYDQVGPRAVATKGPEGCHAIAVKAWETKRRKARGRADDPPPPALAGSPHGDD